jgi:hypothetical protein
MKTFTRSVAEKVQERTNEIPVNQHELTLRNHIRFTRFYEALREKRKSCPVISIFTRLMTRLYVLKKPASCVLKNSH